MTLKWLKAVLVFSACSMAVCALVFHISLAGHAAGAILYVSESDPSCAGMAPCFTSIQAAVDSASSGDEIRVAAGNYKGTQTRIATNGRSYRQVLFVDKSLLIKGGYNPTNYAGPNPGVHKTVIDAQRDGRGVTILGSGEEEVILDGLTITGGDYTGFGQSPGGATCGGSNQDCGGGLFANSVRVELHNMMIYDNISGRINEYSRGGGIYFSFLSSGSQIVDTKVISNTATSSGGTGGGLQVQSGYGLKVTRSIFRDNRSASEGGGINIFQPENLVVIEDSQIEYNLSNNATGGGLEARLIFDGLALKLERVSFLNNQVNMFGAALRIEKQGSDPSSVQMSNVLFAGNTATTHANNNAAIEIQGGSGASLSVEAKHLTFANHPEITALRARQNYAFPLVIDLTNTLIDTAYYGFSAVDNQPGGNITINHHYTLMSEVQQLENVLFGTPVFLSDHTVSGDPKLVVNNRLGEGSAAIDAGIDAGINTDIDGQARPNGAGFDIGADEYSYQAFLFMPVLSK